MSFWAVVSLLWENDLVYNPQNKIMLKDKAGTYRFTFTLQKYHSFQNSYLYCKSINL